MNETRASRGPRLVTEYKDRWWREGEEMEGYCGSVKWRAVCEEEGWFVTFNLHWSPMALTRKTWRETGSNIPHTQARKQTHICSRLLSKNLWPLPPHTCSACEEPNRKWKDYLAMNCNTTDQRWHSCTLRSVRRPLLPPSHHKFTPRAVVFQSRAQHGTLLNMELTVFIVRYFSSFRGEEVVMEAVSTRCLGHTDISAVLGRPWGMFVWNHFFFLWFVTVHKASRSSPRSDKSNNESNVAPVEKK